MGEVYLVAAIKTDRLVKLLPELGIAARQDMEQLMANNLLKFVLAFSQLSSRKHDRCSARVGGVAFFGPGCLDQLNCRRQWQLECAQERT